MRRPEDLRRADRRLKESSMGRRAELLRLCMQFLLFFFLLLLLQTTLLHSPFPLTSGLLLGRSEVLRSLRHYLRTQSQGHQTIDRLEERGAERGSARRSSLKGRERATVSQTNIGTVSKATLRKRLRDGGGALMGFSERIHTILT